MRHAVIDKKTNKVINVIIYDGVSAWNPPNDCFILQNDKVNRGDIYDPVNKIFKKDGHVTN
jgi:hypothetical protein